MAPAAPRTFSLSQIQTYLGCALKYRFQYIDKTPKPWRAAALAFGSSIHAAVEFFQRLRFEGKTPDVAEVLRIFEADWAAQNTEAVLYAEWESAEGLLKQGKAMLSLYVEAQAAARPVAIEQPFELELADPETGECLDVRLRGIFDLVEDGDVLVDLKTAGRAISPDDLERHLQLSTYALVYFLLQGRVPALRLDCLLKTKTPRLERYETSRSVEDLGWTARLIQGVAKAIETEHFFPNPSWRCSDCEYFAHCQRWRGQEELSGQLISIR